MGYLGMQDIEDSLPSYPHVGVICFLLNIFSFILRYVWIDQKYLGKTLLVQLLRIFCRIIIAIICRVITPLLRCIFSREFERLRLGRLIFQMGDIG